MTTPLYSPGITSCNRDASAEQICHTAPQPISVLLIKDDATAVDRLQSELGAITDVAITAVCRTLQEGISLLRWKAFDVVIFDIRFRECVTAEAVIRTIKRTTCARTMILSEESRLPLVQLALELGVDAFLLDSDPAHCVANAARLIMAGRSRVVSPALRLDTLRLTPTERQLLKLIAHGLKPPQIAQRRVVAQATVRKQIELLIEKLGLANREELIAWSVRNGYAEISIDDL